MQDIFGEVHMLSHLVGQSNRADIRRLRHLEQEIGRRDETLAARDERIMTLTRERDELGHRARTIEGERPVQTLPIVEPACTRALEARLAREAAHAEALEERLAVLSRATERLGADLDAEIARRTAAEAELSSLEATLEGTGQDEGADPVHEWIDGRIFLYVGGRPRQVTSLRRFVDERGGRLLSHDGGIEDSLALLPGLVGQADCAVFPVSCISHEASILLRRHCKALAKPFRPVRTASLASFVHVLALQERTAGL